LAQIGCQNLCRADHRKVARKRGRGGSLRVPDLDNTTPQSAIVVAEIDGRQIEIDFLTHVLGVQSPGLENAVAANTASRHPFGGSRWAAILSSTTASDPRGKVIISCNFAAKAKTIAGTGSAARDAPRPIW